MPCVFMSVGNESFGVFVDAMVGEQHMILKPKSPLLNGIRGFLGASILSTGEICTVLAPGDLLASLPGGSVAATIARRLEQGSERKRLILLAEDSITTRAQEVRILEGAGYEVVAATDGLDAYGKLGSRHFDAVVSDINMPRLDGLQLAEKIRAIPEYTNLPIILVTSLSSDEDKRRGLEIGANAYITKPEFDQSILLECLERLVG
jgi:two-component system chemotaxis sensor kinase CheA